MQTAYSRRRAGRTPRYKRPQPQEQALTISPFMIWLAAGLALFVLSSSLFYLSWNRMPERIEYMPRVIESRLFPTRPHHPYVAAPTTNASPEEALQQLSLEGLAAADAVPTAPAQSDQSVAAAPSGGSSEVAATDKSAAVEVTVDAAPHAQEQAAPVAAFLPAAPAATLQGVRHEAQGWNNCGPTTLAMNLSYYGRTETQRQTAPFLKPDPDDKNVSPHEMVAYAQSIGYGGQVVVGGDLALLRTLVTNGIPVMVETWYIPEPNDEMGHYLLLTGYNGEQFTFQDSYKGPNVQKDSAHFDELWKVFNRTAIVVWPPEKGELIAAILGDRADEQTMYQKALQVAHDEVNANPQDKFAWFNLGTNLEALGQAQDAAHAYDIARSLQLPWRMLWYQFGPYATYYDVGNYDEVINLANATLTGGGNLEESYFWRGKALAALGRNDEARRDFQQAVKLNANYTEAQQALAALN